VSKFIKDTLTAKQLNISIGYLATGDPGNTWNLLEFNWFSCK